MRTMQHQWTRLLPVRLFGADGESGSTTDPQAGAGDDGEGEGDGKKAVDKFSPEYVEQLRKEAASKRVAAKASAKEAKESAEEVKTLKAELAKIKQAEMSDLEKANTKLEESNTEFETEKAARVAAEAKLKTERIQNAVTMAAVDAGFEDPTDALSMISQDDLVDDEGIISVKTIKARLKVLADKKPYLLKKSRPGSGDGGGTGKPDDPQSFEEKEKGYLKQMTEVGGRIVIGG